MVNFLTYGNFASAILLAYLFTLLKFNSRILNKYANFVFFLSIFYFLKSVSDFFLTDISPLFMIVTLGSVFSIFADFNFFRIKKTSLYWLAYIITITGIFLSGYSDFIHEYNRIILGIPVFILIFYFWDLRKDFSLISVFVMIFTVILIFSHFVIGDYSIILRITFLVLICLFYPAFYRKIDNTEFLKIERIFLFYIYFFSVVISLVGGKIFYDQVTNYTVNEILAEANININTIKTRFDSEFEKARHAVKKIAELPIIRKNIEDKNFDNISVNEELKKIQEVLDAGIVYIMDYEGNTVFSSDYLESITLKGNNYSFRPYFTEALNGQYYDYFALGVTTNLRGFFTSAPVFDSQNNISAVAVVKIDIDFLENFLIDFDPVFFINNANYVFLSNQDNLILDYFDYNLNKIDDFFKFNKILFNRKIYHAEIIRYTEEWNFLYFKNLRKLNDYQLFVIFLILIFEILIQLFFTAYLREQIFVKSVIVSEKKYRTLFENSPNLIALLDNDFNFIECNRKFVWLAGYSSSVLERKNIFDFWGQKENLKTDSVKKMILEGKTFIKEIYFYNSTGQKKNLLAMTSPIDKNNIIFIGVDITEERRMEKELFEEKERLAVSLDSISEGVISTDTEGKILICNKFASKILEVDSHMCIGLNVNDILSVYVSSRKVDIVNDVIDSGVEKNIFHEAFITENKIPAIITVAPLVDNYGEFTGVVIAFRDIRYEKKIEYEMINLQKLESISLFAAGIAHDFNNILTSILGNISVAIKNSHGELKIKNYLLNAENACKNARELTMQLLTFAKGDKPQKELLNINKILRETASFSVRGSKCTLKINIDENLWMIEGESGKIKQVINNIIINGCQAMNDIGTIEVKAENIILDSINSPTGEKGNFIKISISDTGEGIDEENIKKIFDPYFTTKEKGTGLGLATVNAIVKNHGGLIKVNSEKKSGTTFEIYFPGIIKELKILEGETEVLSIDGKGSVLIMDDESDIREVLGLMLSEFGFTAEYAANGEEAIKKYSKDKFKFVMLDITIKNGMGGLETFEKLKEIDPEIKAVVSSGYSKKNISSNYSELGFIGYISKPFTIEELGNIISKIKF
ncbi:MAG: PAS domain S-box protein [Candidatus Muiribacteriota bacterium]